MARLTGCGFEIIGFGVIHHRFVIDFYGNMFPLHFDVFREPFHVLHIYFLYINHVVEAAGTFPVSMRIIYLHFESLLRPAPFLVLGMKINTRIRAGLSHHVHLQLEIFKVMVFIVSFVKQMGRRAMHYDLAIFY